MWVAIDNKCTIDFTTCKVQCFTKLVDWLGFTTVVCYVNVHDCTGNRIMNKVYTDGVANGCVIFFQIEMFNI